MVRFFVTSFKALQLWKWTPDPEGVNVLKRLIRLSGWLFRYAEEVNGVVTPEGLAVTEWSGAEYLREKKDEAWVSKVSAVFVHPAERSEATALALLRGAGSEIKPKVLVEVFPSPAEPAGDSAGAPMEITIENLPRMKEVFEAVAKSLGKNTNGVLIVSNPPYPHTLFGEDFDGLKPGEGIEYRAFVNIETDGSAVFQRAVAGERLSVPPEKDEETADNG